MSWYLIISITYISFEIIIRGTTKHKNKLVYIIGIPGRGNFGPDEKN